MSDPIQQLLAALAQQQLDTLAKATSRKFENITPALTWEGAKIILPADPYKMAYGEAKSWLERLEKDEAQVVAVNEVVDVFPFDGAVAFMTALRQIYGWATPLPPTGFFEAPPTMLSVDTGPDTKTTIIWGKFAVPGIKGELATGVSKKNNRFVFCIQGAVQKKHLEAIHELAELTRKIVRENSIYRGKAIKLHVNEKGVLDLNTPPSFIDTRRVNPDELVFSTDLMEQVTTNLFTPIEKTAQCRAQKIPLKRGVLLEGPYGTGKTLCAHVTAQKCEAHGWTFITVERVTALHSALLFATVYQPCVIFVEDIDREVTGERTAEIDDILNVVDGIVSKGTEIVTVLTSNNAETINRAMLRPGRLDAVLHIDAPDADAAEKLMRIYGRDLISAEETLVNAKAELAGQIPAVIRKCVERAKLYAISRSDGEAFVIRDEDIERAAKGMKRHLQLLNSTPGDTASVEHQLGARFMDIVEKALLNGGSDGLFSKVSEIHKSVV